MGLGQLIDSQTKILQMLMPRIQWDNEFRDSISLDYPLCSISIDIYVSKFIYFISQKHLLFISHF